MPAFPPFSPQILTCFQTSSLLILPLFCPNKRGHYFISYCCSLCGKGSLWSQMLLPEILPHSLQLLGIFFRGINTPLFLLLFLSETWAQKYLSFISKAYMGDLPSVPPRNINVSHTAQKTKQHIIPKSVQNSTDGNIISENTYFEWNRNLLNRF